MPSPKELLVTFQGVGINFFWNYTLEKKIEFKITCQFPTYFLTDLECSVQNQLFKNAFLASSHFLRQLITGIETRQNS